MKKATKEKHIIKQKVNFKNQIYNQTICGTGKGKVKWVEHAGKG